MEIEILKNDTSIAFRKGTKVIGLIDNQIAEYYDELQFRLENNDPYVSEMVDLSIRGEDKYALMSCINRESRQKAEHLVRPCSRTFEKFVFEDEYYHLIYELSEMYKEVLTEFMEDQKEAYSTHVAQYQTNELCV